MSKGNAFFAKGKNIAGFLTGKLAAAVFLLLGLSCISASCSVRTAGTVTRESSVREGLLQEAADAAVRSLYGNFVPVILFSGEKGDETFWLLQEQIDSLVPFYGYAVEETRGQYREDITKFRELMLAETEENAGTEDDERNIGTSEEDSALADLLRAENEAAMEMRQNAESDFVPHSIRNQIDLEALGNYENLLKEFYTVDPNTMVGSDQLNVADLMAKDMTVSKDGEGYQILIYHTHSQEMFADSVPGDASTSIVGVGEQLTRILTDVYGYKVLHHTVGYDVESRDDAYARSLPEIEKLLEENPSIQVVIDLHRDAMPESTRLVTELDGRPTARFMFFNGLSRTKKTGNISYLYNPNLEDNLAFSFQMQLKAAEYYPGLTRKIYLKGYRYNMHLCPKYLLIELGAQNNTVEEAMNACDPLAHILDMVLTGS